MYRDCVYPCFDVSWHGLCTKTLFWLRLNINYIPHLSCSKYKQLYNNAWCIHIHTHTMSKQPFMKHYTTSFKRQNSVTLWLEISIHLYIYIYEYVYIIQYMVCMLWTSANSQKQKYLDSKSHNRTITHNYRANSALIELVIVYRHFGIATMLLYVQPVDWWQCDAVFGVTNAMLFCLDKCVCVCIYCPHYVRYVFVQFCIQTWSTPSSLASQTKQ